MSHLLTHNNGVCDSRAHDTEHASHTSDIEETHSSPDIRRIKEPHITQRQSSRPKRGVDARDVARGHLHRGFNVIPVHPRSKCPKGKNWQHQRIGDNEISERFNADDNVGVLLGEPSGWLIDIDIDEGRGLGLADRFLPPTGMVWGRESRPRSHYVYRVNEPVRSRVWKGETGQMIVELRSTGRQTIAPGSTHPSGELVRFDNDGEPARVDPGNVVAALNLFARELGSTEATEGRSVVSVTSVAPMQSTNRQQRRRLCEHDVEQLLLTKHDEMVQIAEQCKVVRSPDRHDQLIRLVRGWAIDLELREYIKSDEQGALPPGLRCRLKEMWHEPNKDRFPHRSFADNWGEFISAWPSVKCPLSVDYGAAAFARARAKPIPKEILSFYDDDPARQLLLSAFRELTIMCGDIVFLSSSQMARGLDAELSRKGCTTFASKRTAANQILNQLDKDRPQSLEIVERSKPGSRRAHRVRYLLSTDQPSPEEAP